MKASRELINVFRETAERLSKPYYYYNFMSAASCNVGQLCQTVMGVLENELFEKYLKPAITYCGEYKQTIHKNWVCDETGIPIATIWRELHKLGLTPDDIVEIEEAGRTRQAAIEYFINKANELELQLLNESVVKDKIAVQQSVNI